ncbi:hypothetical protein AAVH_39193, partial [Aphelenchoides avenae]
MTTAFTLTLETATAATIAFETTTVVATNTTDPWWDAPTTPAGFTYDDFHKPFRLAQAVSGFVAHAISLFLFARIFRRVFRGNEISSLLRMFFVLWIIEDLVALPYLMIFIQWVFEQFIEDCWWCGRYTIWTILFERSVSPGLSVVVFFLTLDRCLTLYLGLHYRLLYSRIVLAACIVCTSTVIGITLTVYLLRRFMKLPDE